MRKCIEGHSVRKVESTALDLVSGTTTERKITH